jgi:DMSO/TMAO reductase YedYZ molybdopterin-dependent catalytic subunit
VHEKDDVDVGRQRLLFLALTWVSSNECGATLEDRLDRPGAVVFTNRHPIAGDRSERRLRPLRIGHRTDDPGLDHDIGLSALDAADTARFPWKSADFESIGPFSIPAEMNEFGTIHDWHCTQQPDWHTENMANIDEPAMTPDDEPETQDDRSTPERLSIGTSWFAGAIGAGVALGFGEFAARLSADLTSLVIGVGELLIDITPGNVVATSINNIGTLQKPLLVGGIILASLAIGGWLGIKSRSSRRAVPVGFAAFGLFGAYSTARSDLTNGLGSVVVTFLAAGLGALITLALLQIARSEMVAQPASKSIAPENAIIPGSPLSQAANRRHVLAFGGAAAGAVALTAAGRLGRTSVAERARDQILIDAATTTTTIPGAVTPPTLRPIPSGAFDNLDGITQFITPINPTDEFYLIDTALTKPQVDPSTWTLTINGEYVTTPVTYTYEELLARPMIETEVTLSCVSNPVGGDLVGNAVWTGIPLTELFEEAGIIDPTNAETQVFSRSVDGFTCGFPVPLAYDGRTAMLALKMNGEPLPIIHGFPARIVVAGIYGYVSATKWVEEISITDWIGVDGFWMPRGWSKEGPIKTQSRIDVPRHGTELNAGPTALGGIAWSPTIGIDRVEVSFGEDDVWVQAELANVESDETWIQWRYDWDAPAGDWLIRVRATDKNGFTQSPISVAPAPNGAEGFHTIVVRVG